MIGMGFEVGFKPITLFLCQGNEELGQGMGMGMGKKEDENEMEPRRPTNSFLSFYLSFPFSDHLDSLLCV